MLVYAVQDGARAARVRPRVRRGRPPGYCFHSQAVLPKQDDWYGAIGNGSNMPLHKEIHWQGSNPLNLLPLAVLLPLLLALIALILG